MLSEVLERAVCFDQLDCANLTTFEWWTRWNQAIEETPPPQKSEGVIEEMDRPSGWWTMCPLLPRYATEPLAPDTATLRQRRKNMKERARMPRVGDESCRLCSNRLWIEATLEACTLRRLASSRPRVSGGTWARRHFILTCPTGAHSTTCVPCYAISVPMSSVACLQLFTLRDIQHCWLIDLGPRPVIQRRSRPF